MTDRHELELELVCIDMPGTVFEDRTAVRLGVQDRRLVVDDVPADTEPAVFRLLVHVNGDSDVGNPDWAGPHVQGRTGNRFIYLCWGERIDGTWVGFRRAKLFLSGLSWSRVRRALETGSPLRATIRMSDKRGGPVAATLKPERVEWA
ncbi:MAG: DUF5990 family protein [Anaerolineae bacterium]